MVDPAFDYFALPNGSKLKNRIAKAAMEENMADVPNFNQPGNALHSLYRRWGEGGAGLILSGHVMIDHRAMASPGDLLLARNGPPQNEETWRELASVSQADGAQFWLQLNHPGRQVKKGSGLPAYAPSPIAIDIGKLSSLFEKPLQMSEEQIHDVVERFAWSARKAEELGFSGVEIHAAHGYLISSFLSPLSNKRTDDWGGSRANRARLLFLVIEEVRKSTSSSFGVGVKINTADYQRGGFDQGDLIWMIESLNKLNLDFVELSGGSAESPAMRGSHQKQQRESTKAREAYFLDAAESIMEIAKMPLIITGGISDKRTLDAVISSSTNVLAGVGTAMGLIPDLPNRWAQGENPRPSVSDSWILPGVLTFAASTACVQHNLQLIGSERQPWHGVWPVLAFLLSQWNEKRQMAQYKTWMKGASQCELK